jgi:hypothetical protein
MPEYSQAISVAAGHLEFRFYANEVKLAFGLNFIAPRQLPLAN